jgi:hypothetical protein
MKSEIVCVSSYNPKESYYIYEQFKASVRRVGAEPTILGWHQEWRGLMTKPRRFREFLRKGHQQGEVLIVCDAWDVIFTVHPDEIVDAYRKFNVPIVFNAERNCFPRGDLADQFPDPGTPWRYLNSGFMVGTPEAILTLLESMNLDAIPDDHQLPDGSWFNPNDQEHFTLAYLAQPVKMALDTKAEMCMTGHGTTLQELDFSKPRIRNLITGTEPMAFHFNGGSKNDLQPAVLAHMKL